MHSDLILLICSGSDSSPVGERRALTHNSRNVNRKELRKSMRFVVLLVLYMCIHASVAVQNETGSISEPVSVASVSSNTADNNTFVCEPKHLHIAAQSGDQSGVAMCLEQGIDPDVVLNLAYNDTALMAAVSNNNPDIALMLLRYDAVVDKQNSDGDTALLLAAFSGRITIFQLLLSFGASTDLTNKNQMTALMLAAGKGHVIIVRMLLSEHLYRRRHRAAKGSLEPVPIFAVSNDGFTAMHYACSSGHVAIVRALLNAPMFYNRYGPALCDGGAPVQLVNGGVHSPLMLAAANGHVGVVRQLLAHTPSPNLNERSKADQSTALDYAMQGNHTAIVRLLKRASKR